MSQSVNSIEAAKPDRTLFPWLKRPRIRGRNALRKGGMNHNEHYQTHRKGPMRQENSGEIAGFP